MDFVETDQTEEQTPFEIPTQLDLEDNRRLIFLLEKA